MKPTEAFSIVYDLARQNILDANDCAGDYFLSEERERQLKALEVMHEFVTSRFTGDD